MAATEGADACSEPGLPVSTSLGRSPSLQCARDRAPQIKVLSRIMLSCILLLSYDNFLLHPWGPETIGNPSDQAASTTFSSGSHIICSGPWVTQQPSPASAVLGTDQASGCTCSPTVTPLPVLTAEILGPEGLIFGASDFRPLLPRSSRTSGALIWRLD